MIKFLLNILFFLLITASAFAQPSNDDCTRPYVLPDVTNYCSKVGEFTNIGATPSGYGPATCWNGTNKEVWFRFRAFFTEVSIAIIGTNVAEPNLPPGGSLRAPQVALYAGYCGGVISELECKSDGGTKGAVTIVEGGLIVGEDYLFRVDGFNGGAGTFQICINNYNPPVQPGQDCITGSVLCDKSPFVTHRLSGPGLDNDEASTGCLADGLGASEDQSAWYTWVAKNNGTLTFTIRPVTPGEDIDWELYELPGGIKQCNNKVSLRCNATHPVTNPPSNIVCGDVTGLSLTDNDIFEDLGCNRGENGFCKYIDMVQGRAYTIIINNFTNSGSGFSIEWGGTGEFLGPEANFSISPPSGLRCETDFIVVDSSTFQTGGITKYLWNFGKGAIPQTSNAKGPHSVRYSSFGEKYITLTVETDLGCQVTEIRRVFAEPCCEDLPTLQIRADSVIDASCFGFKDGRIVVSGLSGNPYSDGSNGVPYYTFSLDGISFSPNNRFTNLPPGEYTIYIQDRKGCLTEIKVTIEEPSEIIPDVGLDREVDLGDVIDLTTQILPPDNYAFRWILGDSVYCKTCQDSRALPLYDQYFKIRATNSNGCFGEDSLFIKVKKNYDLWAPNVISANGDKINDVFKLFGKASIKNVESLKIYDRWGELLYVGENLDLLNPLDGWDGTFRGENAMTGVYVYLAKVRFIDDHILEKAGEFTLLR